MQNDRHVSFVVSITATATKPISFGATGPIVERISGLSRSRSGWGLSPNRVSNDERKSKKLF